MHQHNMAHGDIAANIMMDPVGMFPSGWDVLQPSSEEGKLNVPASWKSR